MAKVEQIKVHHPKRTSGNLLSEELGMGKPSNSSKKLSKILFWQINLQHCRAATDNLLAAVGQMKEKAPVLLVQEPYVRKGKPIFSLPNYQVHYHGKNSRSLIAVPRQLRVWSVSSLSDGDFTSILLEGNDKKRILVVSGYLDIKKEVVGDKLEEIVSYSSANKIPILAGFDTNCHSTIWGCDENNNRGDLLEEFTLQNNLCVINKGYEKTFVSHLGSSIIDVTFASNDILSLVTSWAVDTNHQFSDHRKIIFEIDFISTIEITSRNYKIKGWGKKFRGILNGLPGLDCPTTWDPKTLDLELETFQTRLLKALDIACPLKTVQVRPKPCKWLTNELRNLRQAARRCHREWRSCLTESAYDKYRNARKTFQKSLKEAKQKSWVEFSSSIQDTKSLSKISKSLALPKNPPIGLLKNNGTITSSSDETLQVLMDCHFPGSIPPHGENNECTNKSLGNLFIKESPTFSYITKAKVKAAVNSFGWNKSAGPDDLKPIVLQNLNEESYDSLTLLYKVSMALGYTPKAWRQSKVVFIPKIGKDNYDDPKSMRPISLTSFMFKTLERINHWEAIDVHNVTEKMHKLQFAFRNNKSTEGAISKVVDKIESGFLTSQASLACFLDISGAYDNILTKPILNGMKIKSLPTFMINWYKSYLENRVATAKVQNTTITRSLTKGTPQGGVWSSIAWNLAIDHLLQKFNKPPFTVVGFADDLSVILSGIDCNAMVEIMQPVINDIIEECANLGLSINEKKTEVVLFTRKRLKKPKKLVVNNSPIDFSKGAKYLGVFLDDKLSMTKHIESKIDKSKKHLFALRYVIGKKFGPNPHLMRWAFTGIVRPKLTYACHLWAHKINETIKKKLTKLNRLACLNIAPVHKSTPTKGLEVIYNLQPLDLFIECMAIKIHARIQKQVCSSWSGIGKHPKDIGHLLIGKKWVSSIGIQGLPLDKVKKRIWNRKFEVLDFQTYKNDASENSSSVYCYTDGSKIENYAGFGYQIRAKHKEKSSKSIHLGNIATVFQAEVMAILNVASELQHSRNQKIIIRSDSQAAILAINSNNIQSSIVEQCIKTLNRLGETNQVTIQWIKAHVGHAGNEAADQYAKVGSEVIAAGPEPFLPVPQSFIDAKINVKINNTWNKRWKNMKACRQTKLWFKTITDKFKVFLRKGNRYEIGRLVQFITGHCNLRKHQHFINTEINPKCRHCNLDLETPWHLATECPSFQSARTNNFHGQILHSIEWTPQLLLRFCKESKIWSMLESHE